MLLLLIFGCRAFLVLVKISNQNILTSANTMICNLWSDGGIYIQ